MRKANAAVIRANDVTGFVAFKFKFNFTRVPLWLDEVSRTLDSDRVASLMDMCIVDGTEVVFHSAWF